MVENRAIEPDKDEIAHARRELEEARRHLEALQSGTGEPEPSNDAAPDAPGGRLHRLRDVLRARSEETADDEGPAAEFEPHGFPTITRATADSPSAGWDDGDEASAPEATAGGKENWLPHGEPRPVPVDSEFDLDALAARVLGEESGRDEMGGPKTSLFGRAMASPRAL